MTRVEISLAGAADYDVRADDGWLVIEIVHALGDGLDRRRRNGDG